MERQTSRPRPEDACDAAEFVAMMRALKEGSGLTYRDLEARATVRGDVLARSTLANALARDGLPRADLVAAFVRACEGDERLPEWLAARDRIAASARPAPVVPRPAGTGLARRLTPRVWRRVPRAWRLPLVVVVTVAGLVPVVLTAWELSAPDAARGTAAAPSMPPGPVRIRPVRSPALCLTDGHTRDGRYRSEVAVHRPCTEAEPPVTDLVPAGDGTYRVRWRHPAHGDGCLFALTAEVTRGLLEPRNDCTSATRFRIRRADADRARGAAPAYVLTLDAHRCVGAADPAAGPGTEATVQTCDGSAAQRYLIGPAGG
jgi:hypothetical protein